MNIIKYREHKGQAVDVVKRFIQELPSPLISLFDAMAHKPELFETRELE